MVNKTIRPAPFDGPRKFWSEYREASLNWLALGLLLAAWNAVDGDTPETKERPSSLYGHTFVSVRTAQRFATDH